MQVLLWENGNLTGRNIAAARPFIIPTFFKFCIVECKVEATGNRDSMVRTAGASSMIFWCLLWTLQSLSNRWSMLPCLSPNTWTSTCLRGEREEEEDGKEVGRGEKRGERGWREEEVKGREKGREKRERQGDGGKGGRGDEGGMREIVEGER